MLRHFAKVVLAAYRRKDYFRFELRRDYGEIILPISLIFPGIGRDRMST